MTGPYPISDPINEFFADGKFLVSTDVNSSWLAGMDQFWQTFGWKLVDLALQQAGYHVIADLILDDETTCTAQYGAQW